MRKIFIILFGTITSVLHAQSAEALFSKANTQYNLGQYQQALDLYDSIVAQGQHSADLYFNKGNAHYKLNQIAPSILNYEKALLLDSDHKGALTNLPFAQNMTLDAIEPLPQTGFSTFLDRLFKALPVSGWALVCLLTMFFACLFFGAYFMTGYSVRKRIFFSAALVFFVTSGFSMFIAYYQQAQLQSETTAVIFAQQVDFRAEPNLRSEVFVQLHEGTKIVVVEQIEQWAHVRLANGSMGWVPNEAIQQIAF
jgi:tetratricopeptide (TPR) repeat protein